MTTRFWNWRVRRYARRYPNIPDGAWLYDLGRPTPHAVLIHAAWHLQRKERL